MRAACPAASMVRPASDRFMVATVNDARRALLTPWFFGPCFATRERFFPEMAAFWVFLVEGNVCSLTSGGLSHVSHTPWSMRANISE